VRTRRWLTWLVFAVCALAVIEGLGWVTWQALRSERRELEARAQTEFQDSVRLALWRMESQATPIIAKESARPYFQYRSFYVAERAYNRMWQEVEKNEVLVPSPLLESSGQCIRLHFQIEPDGSITSPQAPTGNMLDLAESQYVDAEFVDLATQMLGELTAMLRPVAGAVPENRGAELSLSRPADQAAGSVPPAGPPERGQQLLENLSGKDAEAAKKESEARQLAYQIASAPAENIRRLHSEKSPVSDDTADKSPAAESARVESRGERTDLPAAVSPGDAKVMPRLKAFQSPGPSATEVEQGTFEPLWRTNPRNGSEELLFRRTVRIQGVPTVQGFWMDWPALRSRLLAAAGDLLPQARLEPVAGRPGQSGLRAFRLASIPVDLIPGESPAVAAALVTPTHTTLVMTWLAVIGAIIAIAVVLRTSMELGDRRGRFVSAVTHELRTPLTTFCLYTEMLADDMVKDGPQRAQYLDTLKGESRRLAGIVENVLDYARLGGRRRANGQASCTVGELLDSVRPVLGQCARSAQMELVVDAPGAADLRVAAEPRTVERILLNLVENACKYASDALDRRLHLQVRPGGSTTVSMTLRDHGPGIPRAERRRIFQPFHRAHRDADGPKSGLGLGLALARGLARGMGGDLVLARGGGGGAAFELVLPRLDT